MNTIRIALRVVGAAMMTLALAAWAEGPTASAGGGEQNRVDYWESQGYGTCVKHDGLRTTTFTVPPAPAGQVYTAAIVKAGSDVSVGQAHELDTSVVAGDVLSHSSGKDLSFVILCTKPPPATMTATATASAGTTTTGSPAAATEGPPAAATAAASTAVTPDGASSATATTRASAATTTTTRQSATTKPDGGADSTSRGSAPMTATRASATTATRASAPPTNVASVMTPANSASATTTNTQVSGVSTQASSPAQEPEVAVAGTKAGVDDIAPTRSGLPLGLALAATVGLLLGGAALLLLPGRLSVQRGRHRHH